MHIEQTGCGKPHVPEYFTASSAVASPRTGCRGPWYPVDIVAPPPPPPLPPACADCVTTLLSAIPGSLPQKLAYTLARASDGKMRIDYGTTSVITNPAAAQTILLDHLKLEVRTITAPPLPVPQLPKIPVPGMPAIPALPASPAMTVVELGVRLIEGEQVVGKQYTLPSAAPPGMPAAPGMPAPPALPALVSEVWMSAKLLLPVLTRITGSFGQQMCHCKNAAAGEPPASLFQIPANYKPVGLPAAPAMPAAPSTPSAPAMPPMPKPPSLF
jgi:hypothetical protein